MEAWLNHPIIIFLLLDFCFSSFFVIYKGLTSVSTAIRLEWELSQKIVWTRCLNIIIEVQGVMGAWPWKSFVENTNKYSCNIINDIRMKRLYGHYSGR